MTSDAFKEQLYGFKIMIIMDLGGYRLWEALNKVGRLPKKKAMLHGA